MRRGPCFFDGVSPDKSAVYRDQPPVPCPIRRTSSSRRKRQAKTAEAGKLEGRPAQIEPKDAAEKIQLDAFDPAHGEAQIASEGSKQAGAGRREAEPFAAVGIVLADRR